MPRDPKPSSPPPTARSGVERTAWGLGACFLALYAKVTDVLTDGSLGSSSSTIAGVEFFTELTTMPR